MRTSCLSFSLLLCGSVLLLTAPAVLSQEDMGQRGIKRTAKSPEEVLKELYAKRYAVVIGINKYPNGGSNFSELKGAVNDARNVAKKLRELGFDEVVDLVDEKATKQAVIGTLSKVGRKAKENDMVMFFFAGHGNTEGEGGDQMGFILPTDYDPDDPYTTSIAMTELQNISRLMKAKHVLYAMDSCFSGGIFVHRAIAPKVPEDGRLQYLKNLTTNKAHIVLTAGGKNEVANEAGGTGLFTQALLEGLSGKADPDKTGIITGTQLGLYIQRRIPEHGVKQNPQVGRLGGEGDVVLTLLRPLEEIVKENAPSPGSEQAEALRRQMQEERKKMEEWQKEQTRLMDEQKRKMEAEKVERERQTKLDRERLDQEREQTRRERERAEAARAGADEERRRAEQSGSRKPISPSFGGF